MSNPRYLLILLFFVFTQPLILKAQLETTNSGDVLHIKLPDALNALVMPIPQASNAEMIFYLQAGSALEGDSARGVTNLLVKIYGDKIASALKKGRGGLNNQNIAFNSYCTTERAVFKFNLNPQNIPACLELIRDSLYLAKFSQAELNAARNYILQQMEDAKHDLKKVFQDKLLRGLYVQDHRVLEIQGDVEEIKGFSRATLINSYEKYFACNNTLVTVTGNVVPSAVQDALITTFKYVVRNEFNPETISKIVYLKPMTYTTQFVVDDTLANPEFQMCWQFPGTNSNFHESYTAFLINSLLNDKNNYIQVKLAKLGCKKFTIEYVPNNYSAVLRVTLQPSRQNLFTTYKFVINEFGRLDKTLLNDVMIAAAKIQFKKEYEALKKTKDYPMWIVNHWNFNNESYFSDLRDSIMPIDAKRLEFFINNYFNQSPHITGLRISPTDRQALNVDSSFSEIDASISRYVFTYQQNITSLEGSDNLTKLHNLLQWLNINPDVNVQINGLSDEHEYRKATDQDSIITFIDSMPSFHMVTTDIIKHKPSIRPELARAAKIVRYLYEHGIPAERINGTAMMFKSSNKQEAIDNMVCTLTLNKLHKSPSLYEYHYGKKKQ